MSTPTPDLKLAEINVAQPVGSGADEESSTQECFAGLVFYRDGSVGIQTDRSTYFSATAYFHAANTLLLLMSGDGSKLEYGQPLNMIDLKNPPEGKLVVLEEKINDALDADEVTSNWPGVVKFFTLLREINSTVKVASKH